MKNVLITGISGFAGSYLAEALLAGEDYAITGTYLSGKGLAYLEEYSKKLNLIQVDLNKSDAVFSLIETVHPDIVFHLAALASPQQSFKDPATTFSTNITGQIHLFEALRLKKMVDTRVIVISSAEIYGIVEEKELPIDEMTPLNPVSPYAVSKIAQDYLGLQYFLSYKLNIVRVRPFNHIGPRQGPQYVISSFAKQIAMIEKGEQEPVISVGNLMAKRDFTDVRDIVQAYIGLSEKGQTGQAYNVGSGQSYRIEDMLNKLIALSHKKITVRQDATRLMPLDIPDNRCDNAKVQRDTGWSPKIAIDASLRDVLDYWRNIL